MKRNIIIVLIGLILIGVSGILMFGNSNKRLELDDVILKIDDLSKEIDNLVVDDKLEITKEYEVKLSELRLKINELDGLNYDMYKNKEISLYDYLMNNRKLKKYNNTVEDIEEKFTEKLAG